MNENIYFETIKCEDFEIFNLEYHNKRVVNTNRFKYKFTRVHLSTK